MGSRERTIVRGLTWPLMPLLLVATTVVSMARPPAAGPGFTFTELPFVAALAVCWLVGVTLTGRAFTQPAGWAFLGLGTAVAWSAVTDVYADYALRWEPDAPAGTLVATLSDTSFVWWFLFLALALQLTPPGDRSGRFPRWLRRVTIASSTSFQAAALLRSTPLDTPSRTSPARGPWSP
jgi:hypothetical protein